MSIRESQNWGISPNIGNEKKVKQKFVRKTEINVIRANKITVKNIRIVKGDRRVQIQVNTIQRINNFSKSQIGGKRKIYQSFTE